MHQDYGEHAVSVSRVDNKESSAGVAAREEHFDPLTTHDMDFNSWWTESPPSTSEIVGLSLSIFNASEMNIAAANTAGYRG